MDGVKKGDIIEMHLGSGKEWTISVDGINGCWVRDQQGFSHNIAQISSWNTLVDTEADVGSYPKDTEAAVGGTDCQMDGVKKGDIIEMHLGSGKEWTIQVDGFNGCWVKDTMGKTHNIAQISSWKTFVDTEADVGSYQKDTEAAVGGTNCQMDGAKKGDTIEMHLGSGKEPIARWMASKKE